MCELVNIAPALRNAPRASENYRIVVACAGSTTDGAQLRRFSARVVEIETLALLI